MVLLSGGVTQTVAPTNVSYGVPMYMGTTSSTVPLYGSTSYYSPPVYSAPAPTYSGGATGSTTMVGATPKPAPVVAPAPTPVYTPPPQPTYAPQPQYIPQAPLSGTVSVDVSGLLGGGQDYMRQQQATLAAILAMDANKQQSPPLNYKPYNNILDRFPEATAQRPDLLSDLDGMLNRPVRQQPPKVMGMLDEREPQIDNGLIRQEPKIAPEIAYNPPKPVTADNQQGSMAPQQQVGVYGRQPGYPQQQPQQPQYSPTGAPETDVLYRSQPTTNPEYARARAQQQALQQFAMRQAMQGPASAQPMMPPPGSAPGWNGVISRVGMWSPKVAARRMNEWHQMNEYQRKVAEQQQLNWRQSMGSATSLADANLVQAGQNARAMQGIVADVLKSVMKQPTPETVYNAGMKIVESFPPGPDRDQALAASAAYGLDLWQFRNVPMSQRRDDIHQGAEDRHRRAQQQFEHDRQMNPLRIQAQQLRNTRMSQTNPAAVRLVEARATKAELDVELTRTYGEPMKRAELEQKAAAVHNDIVKHTNEALAKANTINQQYDNAMKNYYNAPGSKMKDPKTGKELTVTYREKALEGIAARFGKLDPDTGIPEDVLNARRMSRQLTADMEKFAAERPVVPAPPPARPQMIAPPPASPMAAQMTKMNPSQKLAVPPQPVQIPQAAVDYYFNNPKGMPKAELDRHWKETFKVDPPLSRTLTTSDPAHNAIVQDFLLQARTNLGAAAPETSVREAARQLARQAGWSF